MLRPSLCVLIVGTCSILSVLGVDQPVVETNYGKVQGGLAESRDGKPYNQFLGVPYAKADRFQPPTKADPWTGVKDATKVGPVCPQLDLNFKDNENPKVIGSEDCLNLNVYTPALPQGGSKVLLPVMVFLTSGGFISGSGNYYSAKYLMDTNTVLVTINARVGVFGFLNVGDNSAAGNQGMKDQVAALKWVQANIENFGGDKARVTLFGHGSGAAAVQYHMLSPLSKGLFHGAISQTGGSMARWAFTRDPIHQSKVLGDKIGCPTGSKAALMDCLKSKDAKDLIPTDYKFIEFREGKEKNDWAPSIEASSSAKPFLTQNPIVLMKEGKIESKVPLIVGVNELDGAIPLFAKTFAKPDFLSKLNAKWNTKLPLILDYKTTATDVDLVSKKIKDFYFDGKDVTEDTQWRLTALMADRFFFRAALNFAIQYSGIAPTYTYCILHQGQYSSFDYNGKGRPSGSTYLDDLQYQFPMGHYNVPEITRDSKDYEYSKNFNKLWTSFAENSKPTKTWGAEKTWDKFNPAATPLALYGIDDDTKPYVVPEDNLKRHAFWAELHENVLKSETENPAPESF